VAVAHQKFKELLNIDYVNISKGTLVIMDIKGIVEKPTWRL